ncbi:hypothetical protein [Streptomyces lacrimifluminis]|uniref:hypothetical protein n=1 Tax=Streptomyces lacrimifluminis TaxID=1500077 RepID=UPI001E459D35|nr:hypothetical protein [Streptomyces lacrimifluminis]
MNDRGEVVGSSAVADGGFHGFVWRRGKMKDLGAFHPLDINNKGHMVGRVDGENTAYLWRAGKLINLRTLGGPSSFPTAMNDKGQVVGLSTTKAGGRKAFLWSKDACASSRWTTPRASTTAARSPAAGCTAPPGSTPPGGTRARSPT